MNNQHLLEGGLYTYFLVANKTGQFAEVLFEVIVKYSILKADVCQ